MTALDDRLRALGDALDLDDTALADVVIARLDEPVGGRRAGVARVAAAVVVAIALTVAIVPSSRRAVAGWLGFDGVRLDRQPGLSVPDTPDSLDRGAVGTVVVVDDSTVLVSEFVGTLDNPALGKVVGDGTDVREVTVGGVLGLWIDGAPHEVSFLDGAGEIVFEGFAGNTLLWQDGSLIRRVEGFADVDAAIAFAESFGT